ncbi:MAG: hypothetical protein K2Q21_05700 [Chitinophagaceae bacterium]|nr:hypothetical protein [Chitinophagaceae bacterium]
MVYLDSDRRDVIKQNDAIYYATWLEFFNSIVLHNLIFPNTAYKFLGFIRFEDIKQHLEYNGFENPIRHDYRHKELLSFIIYCHYIKTKFVR